MQVYKARGMRSGAARARAYGGMRHVAIRYLQSATSSLALRYLNLIYYYWFVAGTGRIINCIY